MLDGRSRRRGASLMSADAPARRLADGTPYFGSLGEIAYDRDEDKVQCHLCGEWFRQVGGSHTNTCYRVERIPEASAPPRGRFRDGLAALLSPWRGT
jgi:hypothetical protein